MVRARIKSHFLLLGSLIFCSMPAMSTEPDIDTWLGEIQQASQSPQGAEEVLRIAFVSSWSKLLQPNMPSIDIKALNSEGMLHTIDAAEMKWAFAMNPWTIPSQVPKWNLAQKLIGTGRISAAHIVFYMSSNKDEPWRFFGKTAGGSNVDLKVGRSKSLSASDIRAWLKKTLGYNAIVLGTKGDFLLVGQLTANFTGKSLQGLALKNSEESLILNDKSNTSMGILGFVKGRGAYAIYRPVFLEKETTNVPVGTKVILDTAP